jgi:hypothetical protein
VATEAARLKGKTSYREEKEKPTEKEKTDLTLTGLLMEGAETSGWQEVFAQRS